MHIILSVEQTVREMINNRLSVSDIMVLVYLLFQFSCNIVRPTNLFEVCVFFVCHYTKLKYFDEIQSVKVVSTLKLILTFWMLDWLGQTCLFIQKTKSSTDNINLLSF